MERVLVSLVSMAIGLSLVCMIWVNVAQAFCRLVF
jgi:hypothetical protein